MGKKILVVDDKKEIRTLLKQYLTQEGFEVLTAADGQQALFVSREQTPDLVLLDLMMPEMNGYEFMRVFSRESNTPVIIITAKIEENDKVIGLELGADDYITKPFSMRELTARVRTVLRRVDNQESRQTEFEPTSVLRILDIELDHAGRWVTVGGLGINLTPSEFDILATLMAAPGRAFTRFELLERIQGAAYEGYERTIDVHVRNLRAKLKSASDRTQYIETVYGTGYRFVSPRREV